MEMFMKMFSLLGTTTNLNAMFFLCDKEEILLYILFMIKLQ